MKKKLMNLADQMLSREQMKGVKGGAWYCDCGGGNGPVKNPDPNNLDCMHVCSGASPYNTNFGMGGSIAGKYSGQNGSMGSFNNGPCIQYSAPWGTWKSGPGC